MIIEKAQELGIALSESTEFHRMMEAKDAMDKHEHIQGMMREYNQKREDIVNLMQGEDVGKNEMMELSHQIDDIQGNLMTHPVFLEMIEAQQGFQSLMQQVNRTIAACIGLDDSDIDDSPEDGCSGSCSSCAGCKH